MRKNRTYKDIKKLNKHLWLKLNNGENPSFAAIDEKCLSGRAYNETMRMILFARKCQRFYETAVFKTV